MGENLSKFIIFAAGAAIGSVVTLSLVKKKYQQLANDEIEEMRDFYLDYNSKEEKTHVEELEEPIVAKSVKIDNKPKTNIVEYASILSKEQYTNYSDSKNNDDEFIEAAPYVIEPEEFGEFEDYDQECLTYYADGVLTDDSGDIVDDIENSVGYDFKEHFGDYESDAVHIRNEQRKVDYEILKVLEPYYETKEEE